MPRVGFEATIPAFKRAKTVHALDRAATVIGGACLWGPIICISKANFRMWPSCKLKGNRKGGERFYSQNTVLWYVTPCSSENAWRFGRTYFRHLQVRGISQEARFVYCQLLNALSLSLIFLLEDWAIRTSETSGISLTTLQYNHVYNHRCDKMKV
jgi:hypothetical protein